MIDQKILKRTRNSQGILIGTARTNPGKDIARPEHLALILRRTTRSCALGVRRRSCPGSRSTRLGVDRR